MSAQHTCTCGHRWQSEGTAPAACPVCGAATATLPDAGATLTFAPGAAPTITLPSAARREGPGAPVEPESVAGYEILGVLGRGGMGVVYKAMDLRLKRVVALKMILAGGHAGAHELARFKTEAEAIARLQHPGIVQIYEVGEHNGLPYFALEYCPGGSLHHKLGGTPLAPTEAAALVEKLARAMQAAHAKGVIHRDLKPGNVLLAEDGTPKVTDFGLARKLDEAGQTQTGAVMGTPSYMAPEQASGNKDTGPACDVYSLGAILYECLTGRPPFKAATLMETLRQVVHDEPVPPSQLQSRTPKDLETIALKCLHKESGKRYGSAGQLAEDLARFQKREPITARPVGPLERGWRWCRRNPALSLALGAVAASLVLGAAFSLGFAVQANKAKKDAEQRAEAEANAKEEARRKEQEAELSNDQLVTSVARSLLRPLALQAQPNQPLPPLSGPEVQAVWELASIREERVRLRFVEEGLRDPLSTRQLRDRAAVALPAALGLDSQRRARAERLLGERLRAGGMSEEQRADMALILANCGIEEQALARRVAALLVQKMSKDMAGGNIYALPALGQGLSAAAERLEPQEARRLAGQAAAILTQTRVRTYGPLWRDRLQALSAVAARLDPGAAREAAAKLMQVVSTIDDPFQLESLAQGLSALEARLDAQGAREVAAGLTHTMGKNLNFLALQVLAQRLSAVAARLDPAGAREVAALLIQTMGKTPGAYALQPLGRALSAVSARLGHREAAEVAGQAAVVFTRTMSKKTTDTSTLPYLVEGLSALAGRLDPVAAREAAATLARTMGTSSRPAALPPLAQGLSAVAQRLDAEAAKEVAAVLTQAMNQTTDSLLLQYLAQGLSSVATRLEAGEAARVAGQAGGILVGAMSKSTDAGSLQRLAQGLTAVAFRLDAAAAREAASSLHRAMRRRPKDQGALAFLAQGLSAVAGSLDAEGAREVAAGLTQAMAETTDPYSLQASARVLPVAAARLGPREAARAAGRAADLLTRTMSNNTNPNALPPLAWGLLPLAAHLDTAGAGKVAAALTETMGKVPDPSSFNFLAEILSAVAGRLEPEAAKEAAVALTRTMCKAPQAAALQYLPGPLSALAARLTPNGAKEVAALLTETMGRVGDPLQLHHLAKGLSAVATRLGPREEARAAGQAAALITRTMSTKPAAAALQHLAPGLTAIAEHLDQEGAGEAATQLGRVMSRHTDNPYSLRLLVQALSAVMARLGPREASQVAGEAAALLTRTMSDNPNNGTYFQLLAPELAVLAPHLGPGAAREATATLTRTMGKNPDDGILQNLAPGLSALTSRLDADGAREAAASLTETMSKVLDWGAGQSWERSLAETLAREPLAATRSRYSTLAAATAAPSSPGTAFAAPALLCAVKPPPPSLPPQALVDLLKRPFCFGPSRRLVLDQLERHYHRSFADQWDFVRFAEEHQLGLDLTSPPQRTDPEGVAQAAGAGK
jgi:hypothetical protein